MKLTIYQYEKCGTCRKAVKILKENGVEFDTIPIFEQPPTVRTLKKLIKQSGLDVKKFFNTSGEVYKEMKLKDQLPQMSEEEQVKLLASNGRLIKRPIITDGTRVTVGFKEEEIGSFWLS